MTDQGHARFELLQGDMVADTYTLSSVLEMNRDQIGLPDHDSGGLRSPGRQRGKVVRLRLKTRAGIGEIGRGAIREIQKELRG